MSESLERYLREIDHYLAVKRNAKEILAEIRSHILEKAADGQGRISDESIERAISAYGAPREVAAQYLEGAEVIAPVFRKHLFRYTWLLFAAHCAAMAASIVFDLSIVMFPLFIIPRMPGYLWIFYVPMAFVADFGLVAFILMLVTQRRQDLKLPWPTIFLGRPRRGPGLEPPRKRTLAATLALLAVAAFFLARYRTLFFYSVNGGAPVSLLEPASALFYSALFFSMLACAVIALAVRFIVNSAWVNLARDVVMLLLLWVVWNRPVAPAFRDAPGVDIALLGGAFVFAVTVFVAVQCIRSVVFVTREMAYSAGGAPR